MTANARMADFYYKYLDHEMGCVEIGLKDKGQFSTKEFNELNYKCPVILSAMLEELCTACPSAAKQDLCTIGFVISGM